MGAKLPEGEGKRHGLSFRTTRELQDKLRAAAAQSGRSVAHEAELRLEASFAARTSSLTAEDVRQIVREEMGLRPSVEPPERFDHGSWIIPADYLTSLGTRLVDAPARHIGPPVPPAFPDGGHVHIASDQGEGPRRAVGRDGCEACRVGYGATYPCGRSDCPHAGYRHF